MRKVILAILLLSCPSWAATTIRLHLAAGGVATYQGMSLALGPNGLTPTNSITFTTASGTHIQITDAVHTSVIQWISEPFAGAVTMSGTETFSFYGGEAAAANNASIEFDLYKYSGGSLGGAAFCTGILSTELTTTLTTNHAPTCSASSTSFAIGDRLVVKVYIINCATSGCPSGTMAAGSPGVTLHYDGHTASADGDTNLALAETITFTPEGGSGGTPSLVQVADDLDWAQNYFQTRVTTGITSGETLLSNLPNPTGAGNLLTVHLELDDTLLYPTVTDDKGDTFYIGNVCKDTTNGEDVLMYYAPNVASGARRITTTFAATTFNTSPPAVAEWTNVATSDPIDGSSCAFVNSTTVAAGSVTPNYSGDLVVQHAWNDWLSTLPTGGGIGLHYTKGSQTNITWIKFIDGWAWANGGQYGIYNSTSALNATFTTSTAGFNSPVIFFRSSAGGTAPAAGIRVVARKNIPFTSGSLSFSTNPLKTYFPCPPTANLMIANYAGPNDDMTAVSDSATNTWTSNHAQFCDSGNLTCVHNYSARGATVSPDQWIQLTFSAVSDDTVQLYCVAGAKTAPFDTAATGTGDQTVAGNQTLVSITPSTSNGLVIASGSQVFNTTSGFSTTGQYYDGCYWSAENTDIDGCAANNAWGHVYNVTTSAINWTATFQVGGTAIAQWAAEADAYEALPATPVRHRGSVVSQ